MRFSDFSPTLWVSTKDEMKAFYLYKRMPNDLGMKEVSNLDELEIDSERNGILLAKNLQRACF